MVDVPARTGNYGPETGGGGGIAGLTGVDPVVIDSTDPKHPVISLRVALELFGGSIEGGGQVVPPDTTTDVAGTVLLELPPPEANVIRATFNCSVRLQGDSPQVYFQLLLDGAPLDVPIGSLLALTGTGVDVTMNAGFQTTFAIPIEPVVDIRVKITTAAGTTATLNPGAGLGTDAATTIFIEFLKQVF